MKDGQRCLVFVSPVFLFPNDAGGKIRTTNILRGLKGGAFNVVLMSPATEQEQQRWQAELRGVCDEFVAWTPQPRRPKFMRVLDLLRNLPVNVVADLTAAGLRAVRQVLARPAIDVVVFDFVHSAVLKPDVLTPRAVCFTHNVEAEIFSRHAEQADNWLRRAVWVSQYRKMLRYEGTVLRQFDRTVAVSERDAAFFRNSYGVTHVEAIPTGVDLDFFSWQAPPSVEQALPPTVIFTGSMDWRANIDGIQFFVTAVWPIVLAERPDARFLVVGRNPAPELLALAQKTRNVEFTGFVDDVRPFVHAAHVFVIPLMVGGGTRIKAFEAMAMGCPVVSTAIGMEGLDADPDMHFLQRNSGPEIARGLLNLLADGVLRNRLSVAARELVEARFGHKRVAQAFEDICARALQADPVSAALRLP